MQQPEPEMTPEELQQLANEICEWQEEQKRMLLDSWETDYRGGHIAVVGSDPICGGLPESEAQKYIAVVK